MFETTEEPDYIVSLDNDAAVGVSQLKEWFDSDDETKPLQAGISLLFRIQLQVSFKDKLLIATSRFGATFLCVTSSSVWSKSGLWSFCRITVRATGSYSFSASQGVATPLANDGYTLTSSVASTFSNAPLTNKPYSRILGMITILFTSTRTFSKYASLPVTISHGLWSSAARRYVENVVAKGHRVLA